MNEELIKYIHSSHPWASEALMESIADMDPASYNQAVNAMRKLGVELDPLNVQRASKKLKKESSKTLKAVKLSEKSVKDTLRSFERDLDPLLAIKELSDAAGGIVDGLASSFQNLTGNVPVLGKGVNAVIGGARLGQAAVVGTIGLIGTILTNQEKSMRAMIDLGLMPEDLRIYDTIRQNAALTGMSFSELTAQFAQYKDVLVNVDGDFSRNARSMSLMISSVEQNSKVLGDMGYTTEQLSARFLEEADLLYKLGGLESLNTQTQKRINDNLRNSSEMATVMAALTGNSREAMLKSREEALTDVDFRLALHQNEAYLIDNFGEGSVQKIVEAQSIIGAAFENAIPGIGALIEDLLPNTIKNIQFDRTSVNDASQELKDVLKYLPGDVQQQFFDIFNRAAVGDITDNEIVAAAASIATSFESAPTTYSKAPDAIKFRDLQAAATISLTSIKNATVESIQASRSAVGVQTELADTSIDAIDAARVGFRTATDAIAPGFATGSMAIGAFGGTIDKLGKVISFVFPQMASYEEQLRRQQERYEQDEEMEDEQTRSYSNPNAYQSYSNGYVPPGSNQQDSQGITPEMWDYTNPNRVVDPQVELYRRLSRGEAAGTLNDEETAALAQIRQERNSLIAPTDSSVDLSGVTASPANNPLFSMNGASRMTSPTAVDEMSNTLSGPYSELQRIFGAPVTINDAIAKAGTTRETKTTGSQHFHGRALDLSVRGMNDAEKMRLFDSAMLAGFTSFGFGSNILHVDTRTSEAASWTYGGLQSFGGEDTDILQARVRSGNTVPVAPRPSAVPNTPPPSTGNPAAEQAELDAIAAAEAEAARILARANEAMRSDQAAEAGVQ